MRISIVGGGPAGSSLAIRLARRGLAVDLFERARFPRAKPCGEGLMPKAVQPHTRPHQLAPPQPKPHQLAPARTNPRHHMASRGNRHYLAPTPAC